MGRRPQTFPFGEIKCGKQDIEPDLGKNALLERIPSVAVKQQQELTRQEKKMQQSGSMAQRGKKPTMKLG